MDSVSQNKAVAYLAKHVNEAPENLKKFISDLYEYQTAGKRLEEARQESIKTLEQLDKKMEQLYGSIEATVRIVARELGDDKVKEFSDKLEPIKTEEEVNATHNS